jgi:hypothetical protein
VGGGSVGVAVGGLVGTAVGGAAGVAVGVAVALGLALAQSGTSVRGSGPQPGSASRLPASKEPKMVDERMRATLREA